MKVNSYDMLADAFIHSKDDKAKVIISEFDNRKLINLLIWLSQEHAQGVYTLAAVNDLVYHEVLSRMKRRKDMACKKGSCKKPTKKK